jgi:hypothetical protein
MAEYSPLLVAHVRATALRRAVFGTMDYQQTGHKGPLAFHGARRTCPFCGDWYKRHGGYVDHRDRCDPTVPTRSDEPERPDP